MKVNQPLLKVTSILLILAGLLLCLPISSVAQKLKMAPMNPDFLTYQARKQLFQASGLTTHSYGYIPSPIDFSHIKGERVAAARLTGSAIASSYDLRDYGRVTSVKDQGDCNSCWAFASMGSLESTMMPGEVWDFSENNMKNRHGFDWGCCRGGNFSIAAAYLLRWDGPVTEADDPYSVSCTGSTSHTIQKHVQEAIFIPERATALDNDNIKQAVMTYGAVGVSFFYNDDYYNATNYAYYCNNEADFDAEGWHAVCVVGWDDCYSSGNFTSGTQPPGDGAFIIKNSWGPSWGDNGYFYISYYDQNLARFECPAVFRAEPNDNYAAVYQYDPLGCVANYGYENSETGWFANVFTSTGTRPITAVGWYASTPNSTYELYIYRNTTSGPINPSGLVLQQSGTIANAGYTTIPLQSRVSLSKGQKFSVVVKQTTPNYQGPLPVEGQIQGYSMGARGNVGESYCSDNGYDWKDINNVYNNMNFCIKAYAIDAPSMPPTISITSPTTGADYYTSQSSISISGIASDDNWVDKVTCKNMTTGLSATCSNGGNWATWYALTVPLRPEVANEIVVTASDGEGNEATANVKVIHDATSPLVSITSPTTQSYYKVDAAVISIEGIASDINGVTGVTWSNSGTGKSGNCTCTVNGSDTNWSASGITLAEGIYANLITVTAKDRAGNTATDTFSVHKYGAFAGFKIMPSKVGLIRGAAQDFKIVPIDILGNERPIPESATPVWSTNAGVIDPVTGEYTAGSQSAVVTLTAAGQSSSVDVEVFPYNANGLGNEELDKVAYVLERWWGGELNQPTDVAFTTDGSIYITDCNSNRIQKYSTNGSYDDTFAGLGSPSFSNPSSIAVDSHGNFYISDATKNRIQKYNSSWQYVSSWGTYGTGNGQLNNPQGIAVDRNDNIYVADSKNNRIQKFNSSGNYLAQLSSPTTSGANYVMPKDVAVYYDCSTNKTYIYVSDFANHLIHKFTEEIVNGKTVYQKLTTLGGPGSLDGLFDNPYGLDVDASGNVYVSDFFNDRIQKFSAEGVFEGNFGAFGTNGGSFSRPTGICRDSEGNIYIADRNNNRIQKYVPVQVSTIELTAPTTEGSYWTKNSNVCLSGITTGLISSVTWSNTTTGVSGKCVGVKAWTTENIPLAIGLNNIVITGTVPTGSNEEISLDVYYALDEHSIAIVKPTPLPSTIESGGSTLLNAVATDSKGHTITYNWSDGDAGGSFADAHAASTTYTAPTNTTTTTKEIHIACRAVCLENQEVSSEASAILNVLGAHNLSFTIAPTVDLTTVAPGQEVKCSVAASDSLGHTISYVWVDGGAGGTFLGSSNAKNVSYRAPKNATGANKQITLYCTARCAVITSKVISSSVVLSVTDPAPTIAITGPAFATKNTESGTLKTANRTGATITLSGTASADTTTITWVNGATCNSGTIEGTENWTIPNIEIIDGVANRIAVMAWDLANKSASDILEVTTTEVSDADGWEGICMVALPIIPDEADPSLTVDFSGSHWYIFKNNNYIGYPNLETWFLPTDETIGRGFWTKFDSKAALPCGTIPDESDVTIHLYEKWNIIGQPFMKPILWDTNKIKVRTLYGTEIALKDANSYVKTYAWGWRQNEDNPYTGEYYLIGDPSVFTGATKTLAPWRGYWLKALQECYLVIPAPEN